MRDSKAAQILDLLATTDMSMSEIAESVGCLSAYVRVVNQRKAQGGQRQTDRKYAAKNAERIRVRQNERMAERRRLEPAYAELCRERYRLWYKKNHLDPAFRERERNRSRRWREKRRLAAKATHNGVRGGK